VFPAPLFALGSRGEVLGPLSGLYDAAGRHLSGKVHRFEIYRLGLLDLKSDGYLYFCRLCGEQNAWSFPASLLDLDHFFGSGMAGDLYNYLFSNGLCFMGLSDSGVLPTDKK
jgi:hypothetical protein